jgi:hypothetical protein
MQDKRSSVWVFIVLVFVLSIPFWVLGNVYRMELLPGLPISSLAAFTPGIAAVVMVFRDDRFSAVSRLLRRSFDFNRIRDKKWYFVFLLFNPAVAIIAFMVLRAMGIAVPTPPPLTLAVVPMSVSFFIAALGEEIGWTGYATAPFLRRWGILQTGVLLGLVWAVFHFILLAQVDRSWEWIAWWSLGTLSLRTVMVWLYSHAGDGVFAAAVFHTMINLSWQLFPINGSFYDPRVFSVATLVLAILMAASRQLVSRTSKPTA